jgi:ABC-type glutathione transport system ATPase component
MSAALLEARDVRQRYGARIVLDGVSFALERGERLALVGESGAGKSTLARCLVGLERPHGGTVLLEGVDLADMDERARRSAARTIQIVFQDSLSALDPRQTVKAALGEPLAIHRLLKPRERALAALALCEAVGLDPDCVARYPHELSGGQRQRVAIGRALALEPRCLVLDEPVSSLDVSIRAQVSNLLADLSERRGLALLVIAHDLAWVRHLASRVALLDQGRLVEAGPCQRVLAAPEHPRTRALLAAVPSLPRREPNAGSG